MISGNVFCLFQQFLCYELWDVQDESWSLCGLWYGFLGTGRAGEGYLHCEMTFHIAIHIWRNRVPSMLPPPKVLLLCRSWGACVPCRSQRLRQLEFRLLVGTTMLDRFWARGQTKCNTLLMLATSVFGRIHRWPCYVMAQPKSRLDIPWPNDAECTGHVWCHLPCWYPLFCDVESLAGCVGG